MPNTHARVDITNWNLRFIKECMSNGKIVVEFGHIPAGKIGKHVTWQNDKKMIFDNISIGNPGEFSSAAFRINGIHDIALVIGGIGGGAGAVFKEISGQIGIYRISRRGRLEGFSKYRHTDPTTAEWVANVRAVSKQGAHNVVRLVINRDAKSYVDGTAHIR